MVSAKIREKFHKKFKKKDTVTISILMEELSISRPTATNLMQELWSEDIIEPIFSRSIEKCYIISS